MKISVLGCGWLGYPLSRHLVKKGHRVCGSTTSVKKLDLLKAAGITPCLIEVSARAESDRPETGQVESGRSEAGHLVSDECESFWDANMLFVNIPPGRSRGDVLSRHPSEIAVIAARAEERGIPWVVFASSTSVYGKFGGLKTEEDAGQDVPSSDSGKALLHCEKIILDSDFDSTIIRFGGLYGYDRHPARNLAGRKNLSDAGKPVNLIHQDDCIGIVGTLVEQGSQNEIYNAVSDMHPTRREFYQYIAREYSLKEPEFLKDEDTNRYKTVSNRKVKNKLDYTFLYPDPRSHAP